MGVRARKRVPAVTAVAAGFSVALLLGAATRWDAVVGHTALLQTAQRPEWLQPGTMLGLQPNMMPALDRLPHDALPEDVPSAEDALEIASRRLNAAYEELKTRHEKLMRGEEEFAMDRTGHSVERQMQQERLEVAAKELGEYAHVLNAEKEAINARRSELEIAAGSPYIAYTDAVQKSFGKYVVPPPVQEGVQVAPSPPYTYLSIYIFMYVHVYAYMVKNLSLHATRERSSRSLHYHAAASLLTLHAAQQHCHATALFADPAYANR